jgi:hypothetical protein
MPSALIEFSLQAKNIVDTARAFAIQEKAMYLSHTYYSSILVGNGAHSHGGGPCPPVEINEYLKS